jgi:hypothetical protein
VVPWREFAGDLGSLGLTMIDVNQEFLFMVLGVSHFSLLQFGVVFLDLGQVVSEEALTADFFNRRAVFHLV